MQPGLGSPNASWTQRSTQASKMQVTTIDDVDLLVLELSRYLTVVICNVCYFIQIKSKTILKIQDNHLAVDLTFFSCFCLNPAGRQEEMHWSKTLALISMTPSMIPSCKILQTNPQLNRTSASTPAVQWKTDNLGCMPCTLLSVSQTSSANF